MVLGRIECSDPNIQIAGAEPTERYAG